MIAMFRLYILFIMILISSAAFADPGNPDALIIGNLDGSWINITPGEIVEIPVYINTDEPVGAISIPISIESRFVEEWISLEYLGPLTTWPIIGYNEPNQDKVNSNYTTQSLIGCYKNTASTAGQVLNTNGQYVLIARLTVRINSDPQELYGFTTLMGGTDKTLGAFHLTNLLGTDVWYPLAIGGGMGMLYEYRIGDANMYAGTWPPAVDGSDATYLMNYFRGTELPCYINGFYAAADVNGSCTVTGADITYFTSYFRGLVQLQFCTNYPTAWPRPGDIPANAPTGWPNCE